MYLNELLNNIEVISVTGSPEIKEVDSITNNSREVNNRSIFVAIKGFKTDGRIFIPDAISKGAQAVVLEETETIPDEIFIANDVVKIVVSNSRKIFAILSCAIKGEPSKKLKLIGVTGSNGKTTTAFYIKNLLETAGYKTGLLGTIANYVGEETIDSTLTTPESNIINKYLKEMVDSNCTHCVMEVSSHSLALDRVYGLDFDYAIFTNISSDHLDFHTDFNNYFNSKKILFDTLKPKGTIIYNQDDEYSRSIIKDNKCKKFSYGTSDESIFQITDIDYNLEGTSFNLSVNGNKFHFHTRLVGRFNAYNAAAAILFGLLENIDTDTIIDSINSTPQVPGRFEVIGNKIKKIVIDYSHTADSLQKALESLRHIVQRTRPICTVFGCGGDRDRSKRPIMGRIATELSDQTIVTSDNPRSEDPLKIIEEIMNGIEGKVVPIIPDREAAIKEAVCNSESNTVILIAGKGHEEYQLINGIKNHFSDKEMALKYLEECE